MNREITKYTVTNEQGGSNMDAMQYEGRPLHEAILTIMRSQQHLYSLGFFDNDVAEFTRLWGHRVWLGCSQVYGHYIHADNSRHPHFAVRGWYTIEDVDDGIAAVTLLRSCYDGSAFTCEGDYLRAVLVPNLDYPAQWQADQSRIYMP